MHVIGKTMLTRYAKSDQNIPCSLATNGHTEGQTDGQTHIVTIVHT